ncbi:sulfurtransferase [Aquaspirillum sp. LM1]|jgi:rhodanese-related sulfurtransferase|uniref:rhodanese-like domain-containing protein n=1 Tax=Aquaspirillum sp. LM1 TaxID=1938604 RepID=UPI000983B464|nr:rhodanese-like domain-containing protein [Aquaspirillum sp. LM1]AQR65138.1 sulfurtransferase [Aquaspirillum sp. LM1]
MKTAHDLVLAARAQIEELSPQDAQRWQAATAARVLDVREPDEFAAGHLPGAVNVPRGMLEFRIGELQPDGDAAILLYCKTSGRAALATQSLHSLGYTRLRSVAGGFDQWQADGLSVEKPVLPSFE